MLTITIPETEYFDEVLEEFVTIEPLTAELEHSLVSLSKWESKWETPFLAPGARTDQQTLDYIRCMCISPVNDPRVFGAITNEILEQVGTYISAPMTATVFYDGSTSRGSSETVTSELIYYWMVALNIPFECQNWHLNRLLTLIRVINVKNAPPKKISGSELAARNRRLNEARRKAANTTG